MDDIKVSIVVCSYNQEKYIRQTLDSIISQEHPYTWELIVCDDASQDQTPKIITEYASIYREIVPVLRKKNVGLIKNYYDAISKCQGEYIMICAGDDYWLPNKIFSQVQYLDNHPDNGLCYGDAVIVDKDNNIIGELKGKNDNSFENLLKGNFIPALSICQRRSTSDRYIEEIKPSLQSWTMEDYPMLLWYSVNSKISHLSGNCAAYRILTNSLSHSDDPDKILKFKNSVNDIKKYFISKYTNSTKMDLIKACRLHLKDLLIDYKCFQNQNYKKASMSALKDCQFNRIQYVYSYCRISSTLINRLHLSLSNKLYSIFDKK